MMKAWWRVKGSVAGPVSPAGAAPPTADAESTGANGPVGIAPPTGTGAPSAVHG
jgi:hypothetical protein